MQALRKTSIERSSMRAFWVIKNPTPRKSHKFKFSLFFMLVLLAAGVVIVNLSQKALITENAMRIEKLKDQLKAENYQNEKLIIETETLKSPERIEQIAREKLGMISPSQLEFIQMPTELGDNQGHPKEKITLKKSVSGFIKRLTGKLENALLSDSAYEAEAGIP